MSHKRLVLLICGGCALALIIAARIILPYVVLHRLNAYLADFSPDYSIHIGDLHLSFIRMAYRFEDTEARFKQDNKVFLTVESAEVTIAWRELIHLRILTDVAVDQAKFALTKKLISGSQQRGAKPQKDATAAANKLFPVDVARIDVRRSEVEFADMLDSVGAGSERWRISSIEARVLNLTPVPRNPLTFATVQGTLLGSAPFRVAAEAKRLEDPNAFTAAFELREFDLVAANPMLLHFVPLNFIAGHLDVFAEVKSEHGELEGYVKPFFKKLHVISIHEHFEGIKHFAVEVVAAVGDLLLRRHDDKSVAAMVPFHGDMKHLKVDLGEVISSTLEHGYEKRLTPALENKYELQ